MQKLLPLIASVTLFGLMMIGFTSCKDDEKDPIIVKVTFSSASKTVGEGEQGVKANLVLDNPAPSNVIISYEITGSATRKIGQIAGDYEIVGSVGEVEIAEGQTTGSIELNILSDNTFELDENIILTLDNTSSGQVEIGDADEMQFIIAGSSATASFAASTLSVNEANGQIQEIQVQLTEAVASDVIIEYDISAWKNSSGEFIQGAAIDSVTAFEEELDSYYYDYYIDGTAGQLTIAAGQSSGVIRVAVLPDLLLEDPETFELTLKQSGGISVGTVGKITVTIEQENGTAIALVWPEAQAGPPEKSANMDFILWLEVQNQASKDTLLYDYSTFENTDGLELLFIPNSVAEGIATSLGVSKVNFLSSYVYKTGNIDPLQFEVRFIDFVDGQFEAAGSRVIKTGTYTAANLNNWSSTNASEKGPFQIAQRFAYENGTAVDIGEITVPTKWSRTRSTTITKNLVPRKASLRKMHTAFSKLDLR